MGFEHLIASYGYVAVFLGTFLEGETILILGGFAAHQGYLQLPLVLLVGFAGTFFGDQLYFYIGRHKGIEFVEARPRWQARTRRIFHLLRKHQVLLILGFRFIYGIRVVTPFVLGASGIRPVRYFVLNFTGAVAWTVIIGLLGYFIGEAARQMLSEVRRFELWIFGGIILLGPTVWIVHWLVSKKEKPGRSDNNES